MGKNGFEIECSLPSHYGYCYYQSGIKPISRLYVKNLSRRSVSGSALQIISADILLDYKKTIDILPYESTLDIDVSDIALSPRVLLEDARKSAKITVKLSAENGEILCSAEYNITILPFNMFPGVSAMPELLACFVKPVKETYRLLKSAADLIRGWKLSDLTSGYREKSKDDIRLIAAAIFRALQKREFALKKQPYCETPSAINFTDVLAAEKQADLTELACAFAACLEACGINAVIALSGQECLLGIWLYDNCFLESSFDDITEVKKRCDSLIDDIAVIDVKKIFEGNFSYAESSAALTLAQNDGKYYTIIDIKRCRIANYYPLPLRKKTLSGGYEIIKEERQREKEEPPQSKKPIKQIKIKTQPSKEGQWERRLLDLSLKNNLLNFLPKSNTVQVMSVSIYDTVEKLLSKQSFALLEMPAEFSPAYRGGFDTPLKIKPLSQLISLEHKNGRLRAFTDAKTLNAAVGALYRKEKTSLEETGTSALYAACGFLKWNYHGDKNSFKYAPLLLIPLTLEKKAGGKGFAVTLRDDEFAFNVTLLEFLKQQFGIEMRGGANFSEAGDIESVLAAVKKTVLGFKGWEVTEDVYIASLSFSRFLMWNDIHLNIENFKRNKIISSLAQNKLDSSLLKHGEEEASQKDTLFVPISADNSQYGAVRLSDKNASFVLHGPPGTGKSQTITNIIANAIAKNKRVLFVAQKLAALKVVKKRLDAIGIGDFCLELHSLKTAKNEVCKKLIETSRLKTQGETDFKQKLKELKELKETLEKPVKALHKKRKLGISVYQGILNVIENKNVPDDLIKIDSVFYERLTAEKLSHYQSLLQELVAVSRECGQIYRSPFENVTLTECGEALQIRIINACKILQSEARHLNAYIEMLYEVLGAKARVLTRKKLGALKDLAQMLLKQSAQSALENIEGDGAIPILNNFITVYKTFEEFERRCDEMFKFKVTLPAPFEILREELELFPVDYYKSRLLRKLIRRINRAAKEKVKPERLGEYIIAAISYEEIKQKMSEAGQNLSSLISGKAEKVNYHKVADFILQLDVLYKSICKIFTNYDMTSFNVMLENMIKSFPQQVLSSFIKAYDSFEASLKYFCQTLKIDADYYDLDENFLDHISIKAAALRDNIDMLESWCNFNAVSAKLKDEGLEFVLQPLKEGRVSSQSIVACFKKKIYLNFIEREIADDEALSKFSSAVLEEKIEQFKQLNEEFESVTQKEIRLRLIERLPDLTTEGPLSVELMQLQRAYKSNMRGVTVRSMISQCGNLFFTLAPCLLMSPAAVAQYLQPDVNIFDIAVFDEASQIPTAEALGALARSKSVIIVGDPKQLPPTTFFIPDYADEEYPEYEDLESILEDCLALGMTERYLKWHYRSKHESLIAFSNALYYGNKLCTFPSADALQSKVSFKYIENGVYDRGGTRQNAKEAETLVADIIKRLKKNPAQSIGVVTFSISQQTLIENILWQELIRNKLESAAYEREEPLFVKNLESVQGDERDVILFSVCYGPDRYGRLSMNFGPINQTDGWRRLNVAASRAREEMVIYSSITSAMIDLSKNNSRGLAGVKSLLEFAQSGRSMLAVKSSYVEREEEGIGRHIAADLEAAGYECRCNLGVSNFKIDVAVQGEGNRFILAIMCDSKPYDAANSVKDATTLQIKMLKKLGWNVMRVWTLNYFNNPSREIKRIKSQIDRISGKGGAAQNTAANGFAVPYTEAEIIYENVLPNFILDEDNESAVKEKLKKIIAAEQPVAKEYLIKRCLSSYGIMRIGPNLRKRMSQLCRNIAKSEEINGTEYFYNDDGATSCKFYRIEESGKIRRKPSEISPYEYIAAAKSILTQKISLYMSDLVKAVASAMKLVRSDETENCIKSAIEYGNAKGLITVNVNGAVTL